MLLERDIVGRPGFWCFPSNVSTSSILWSCRYEALPVITISLPTQTTVGINRRYLRLPTLIIPIPHLLP